MLLTSMFRMLRLSMAAIAWMMSIALAASVTTAEGSSKSQAGSENGSNEQRIYSLIVKPRTHAGTDLAGALEASDASGLSKAANVPLHVLRKMSSGAHVIKLEQPITLSEARVIAARLMHNHPGLEYAEPDRIMRNLTVPNDPGYVNQWHYFAPAGSNQGGINLPLVWNVTTGSASPPIVVAVIDSGYLPHDDFGPTLLGYDFITDPIRANDGDSRDADAHDPGNWVAANECGPGDPATDKNSVWHGTHVAGTIAALMNNHEGGTGVAPNVQRLPVRVTGKCGGVMSDIIDGMRWAAGLSVAGVPVNPNPARILNMSIGDHNLCSPALQAAVDEILNAGKIIVAATGNDSDIILIDEPANCNGVIAVTAHAIDGDLAYYSNVSTQVAISAPGGDCGKITRANGTCTPGVGLGNFAGLGAGIYTTYNTGLTTPDSSPTGDTYFPASGTSSAAPHVSGVAALLLSVTSTLTPGQIKSILQSSARPFPSGSWCTTTGAGLCGAGLLDARAALNTLNASASPPTVTITNALQVVAPNSTVSLSGAAVAGSGRSISSYAWVQLTGASVGTIANNNQANTSFTAPPTGTFSFRLTATDSGGLTGTATATVRVNSPPVLTPLGTQTVTEGNTLSFQVVATDADGDVPIFVSVSLPSSAASLSAAGQFSWPAATPPGNYALTYFVRDNDANSPQGTVNITVQASSSGSPPPPVVAPAPVSGDGGGGGCTLSANGIDMLLPMLVLFSVGLLTQRLKKGTGKK